MSLATQGSMVASAVVLEMAAVVEGALSLYPHDFPRHSVAIVEADRVTYQHVWEIEQPHGTPAVFAAEDGRLFVRKTDAAPDPRGVKLVLRETSADEMSDILQRQGVVEFIQRYAHQVRAVAATSGTAVFSQ